jgi:hypothetical protein
MLEKECDDMEDRDTEIGLVYGQHTMRWYGWGSPVGLGAFALLLALAVAVIRLAFR